MNSIAFGFCLTFVSIVGLAAERDTPNDNLPNHIHTMNGTVVLFADFENRQDDGHVPVYLINRSDQPITLEAQDGDIYLKLESRGENGKWQRAQPHRFSWCGNSYHTVVTRPGHFLRLAGYQPPQGERRTVRYSLYRQSLKVSSNSGAGIASPSDLRLAGADAMAIYNGDFDFVSRVALGEIKLPNVDHQDLQSVAIGALANPRFDADRANRVLIQVIKKFPDKQSTVHFAQLQMLDNAKADSKP